MLTKKLKSKTRKGKTDSAGEEKRPFRLALQRRLGKVAGIEAVFVIVDDDVVHVFSVMAEHESRIFKALMRQEKLVEKDLPDISFDFHTRVHQGRPPRQAVPVDAELVFSR